MLELSLDVSEDKRALEQLPQSLDPQMPRLLGEIGTRLKERARSDFLVKSRGGTGAGGITWKQLTPSELRNKQRQGFRGGLGQRTGDLLSSLEVRYSGSTSWGKPIPPGTVSLEFSDQPKANAFNAERPLFPSQLPAEWYSQVDGSVKQFVDQVSSGLLSKG